MVQPVVFRPLVSLLAVVVVVSIVAPSVVGLGTANVSGEPEISLSVADNRVSAGETTTLEVNAVNRGELNRGSGTGNVENERRVLTARGLTLTASSNGPVTVRTGEVALGALSDGDTRSGAFEITVSEDADPGTYRIPVTVEYKYTEFIGERGSSSHRDETVSEERTVRVVVDEDARFEVLDVEPQAPGDTGTFSLTVENTGEATANDAVVDLSSPSSDLVFGNGTASQAFVEEWEPGDVRTLDFRGNVDADAPVGELPATLSVDYTDDDSVAFTSRSTFGITPADDQTFGFETIESTLRVAQDGSLVGTFTNEGPRAVENVVVTLSPPTRNVQVLEPEVALGELDSGEAVDVEFEIEVSSSARSGPRQFTIETEYETTDGDERTADAIRFRETVEPRQDVFTVAAVDATIQAGDTDRVVLAVTNNKDETVTDISAKVFASRPLSVDDDEAFVGELAPGETTELPFRLTVRGTAMSKDYPIAVDFQYVDASGETRLTDSYRVPVTVTERSGGLFGSVAPGVPIALAGLVLLPLAPLAFRYRRR